MNGRSQRRRGRLGAVLTVVGLSALTVLPAVLPAALPTAMAQAPHPAGPSPSTPNPHPPLGGRAPDGTVTGGSQLLTRSLVQAPGSPHLPANITAAAFMVTDLDTGRVLAARDPHGRYQPASVLKLLTSITILPRLPGGRIVVASSAAANAEGSAVGLVPGGRYTVDTLFQSLLLMSGNDAAQALAEAAGGVPQTVTAMNAEARKLGAWDTIVETASGLDGWTQLTSAYDLTLVLRAAARNPRLLAYSESPTARLPAQKVGKRSWRSVPLFNESQNFYDNVPGAILAKTGFTDAAQHTYVCTAQRNGRRIGVVLLRAQRHPLDQWQQAQGLLDWAYRVPRTSHGVGVLQSVDGSTPTTVPTTASTPTASTLRSAAESTSASAATRPAAAARSQGPSSRMAWWEAAAAIAAVVAALALLRRRRRRGQRV